MVKYCITDPSFYNSIQTFQAYLENIFQYKRPDFIAFRDKVNTNKEKYIEKFLEICKYYKIKKTFLNSTIDERFYGVHLNSKQFHLIKEAKEKKLFTIISTHSIEEIKKAQKFGVDAVTFSPIFFSPNKGNPKGIEELQRVIKSFPTLKIIALGGIVSKEDIKKVKDCGVWGFASIRYFSVK